MKASGDQAACGYMRWLWGHRSSWDRGKAKREIREMAPVPKSPFTLKASSHAVPPQAPSSPPRADKNFWELNFKLPKHHKMLRSEWIMASTAVSRWKGWETLKSHPTPRKGFRSAGVKQDQHWLLPWQVCWCSEESLHMKYLFTCWRAFFFFPLCFHYSCSIRWDI